MINWIQGVVQFKDDVSATIAVQGIGYRVFMLENELAKTIVGSTLAMYIHSYFRETSGTELYGFMTREAQLFFNQLLSISGIGPKGGLGILEQATPHDVQRAIQKGDASVLTKVSGIGKKTAERIIIELRNKVGDGETSTESIQDTAAAIDALTQLGYSQNDAREALHKAPTSAVTVKDKVRAALKQLGKT